MSFLPATLFISGVGLITLTTFAVSATVGCAKAIIKRRKSEAEVIAVPRHPSPPTITQKEEPKEAPITLSAIPLAKTSSRPIEPVYPPYNSALRPHLLPSHYAFH